MLIFGDNNKVTAINFGDTLFGTFLYNAQKSPHWIDFNWKSSTGQTGQSCGIIEWMDFETTRIYTKPGTKERPVSFEDDPDLDQSGILRKQEVRVSYLNDQLTKGKWDISLLWNADVDHSSDKKYQTITFLPDFRYRLEGTDFIPGSSGQGRYELNTTEVPNWIDLYSDEGTIIQGLIRSTFTDINCRFSQKVTMSDWLSGPGQLAGTRCSSPMLNSAFLMPSSSIPTFYTCSDPKNQRKVKK